MVCDGVVPSSCYFPRSHGTFLLGNGSCRCGVVRGFIYVVPEESVKALVVCRVGWGVPGVVLRFVSGMDLS